MRRHCLFYVMQDWSEVKIMLLNWNVGMHEVKPYKCHIHSQNGVKFGYFCRNIICSIRCSFVFVVKIFWCLPRARGGTHIFGRTGMCRSNGSFFYKKSLNMGPFFYQKILKHRSTFLTEPKILGFRMVKTPKIAKFLKNGPIFQEKTLKMGTLFSQNHP